MEILIVNNESLIVIYFKLSYNINEHHSFEIQVFNKLLHIELYYIEVFQKWYLMYIISIILILIWT